MVAAVATNVGRAIVSAAPTVLERVKQSAPQVIAAANDWYKKTTRSNGSVESALQSTGTVATGLQALVHGGMSVEDLSIHIPVINREEATEIRRKLLGIELDLQRRSDSVALVQTGKAPVDVAIANSQNRKLVATAMAALNCSTTEQLRDRLVAIRAVNESMIEAFEVDSHANRRG